MTTASSEVFAWVGMVGVAGAAVGQGCSLFVPKVLGIADGFSIAWAHGVGVLCSGVVASAATKFSDAFHWQPMVGGAALSAATCLVVPAIRAAGLAPVAVFLFSVVSLLQATVIRFGSAGLVEPARGIGEPLWLDIVAAILVLIAAASMCLVPVVELSDRRRRVPIRYLMLGDGDDLSQPFLEKPHGQGDDKASVPSRLHGWVVGLSGISKRALGLVLALVAAALIAFSWFPVRFSEVRDTSGALVPASLLLSFGCGSLGAATAVLAVYSILTRNRPTFVPKAMLPSLLSGALWGGSLVGWLFADSQLPCVFVSPVVNGGAAIVAALLGGMAFWEADGILAVTMLSIGCISLAVGSSLLAIAGTGWHVLF